MKLLAQSAPDQLGVHAQVPFVMHVPLLLQQLRHGEAAKLSILLQIFIPVLLLTKMEYGVGVADEILKIYAPREHAGRGTVVPTTMGGGL
jgi:hypothetical protein